MAIINLDVILAKNFGKDEALFNAKIYFGEPGQDAKTNQIPVTIIQESGAEVVAQQPIRTSAGGMAQLNGSPIKISIDGEFSMRIDTEDDVQVYNFKQNGTESVDVTALLNASALDLGFESTDIGVKLISSALGTSLDNAEYILELVSSLVFELPTDIPAGATVVSLNSSGVLVTSAGQFTLKPKQADITQNTENLIKGNQNWNVAGADGTITNVIQTFAAGKEFTLGWSVRAGDSLVDVIRNNGEVTAASGIVDFIYTQDEAEQINEDDSYFSIINKAEVQTYAKGLSVNGLEIDSSTPGQVKLSIDFTVYTGGLAIQSLSNKRGQVQPINNEESERTTFNINNFQFLNMNKYVHAVDEKSSGTNGGTSIIGDQDRDLNLLVSNTLGIPPIASNELTLESGTYYARVRAPAFATDGHQVLITQDDNTVLLTGSSNYTLANLSTTNFTTAEGIFTLLAQTNVKVRHYCQASIPNDGLGKFAGRPGGVERYTSLEIWKIA